MSEESKEYSNGEVTIQWQPEKCIHSSNCWRGLPKAFNPNDRPWISLDNVTTEEIVEQVTKCPSGALSVKGDAPAANTSQEDLTEVVVIKNGPVRVKGALNIVHKDGSFQRGEDIYLCRCGQSANKPFCDGAHRKCGFKDE